MSVEHRVQKQNALFPLDAGLKNTNPMTS